MMKPEPKPKPELPSLPAPAEVPAVPVKPDATPVEKLSPEEQMERFAQDQKENDWGHRPC